MYLKVIEKIECDKLIFIPMIDGINLTPEQVKRYEDQDYVIP